MPPRRAAPSSRNPRPRTSPGRANQRLRTRKELLAAAARLLKTGAPPDMDQVAAEAMVSRATAYRYFPTVEALFAEAPIDSATPDPAGVFAGCSSQDPVDRVELAERRLHEMVFQSQSQLRHMLAASLRRPPPRPGPGAVPARQNRRADLIREALNPARGRFTPAAYDRLAAALALVYGTESMIVFTDVLRLDAAAARRVKAWACRVLVQAALAESADAASVRRRR